MYPPPPSSSVLPGPRPHWTGPITSTCHQPQDHLPQPHPIISPIPSPASGPPPAPAPSHYQPHPTTSPVPLPALQLPPPPSHHQSQAPQAHSITSSIPSPMSPRSHPVHSPSHPRPPLPSLGAYHPSSPQGTVLRVHPQPPNPAAPSALLPAADPPTPLPGTSWSEHRQLLWSIRPCLTHPPSQEVANQQHQELHAGDWGFGRTRPPQLQREDLGGTSHPAAAVVSGRAWPYAPACLCVLVCVCLVAGFDPIQDSRQAPLVSSNKSLTGE